MSLAWRELVRRPGRFAVAGGALTLLVVLLLLLGGLLDGLYLGSTGAIRAQRADVFVYSATARDSIVRSRIEPDLREQVERVDGVEATGGLGVAMLGATVEGDDDVLDVAVTGYELAPEGVPEPPAPGTGYADERLRADGVRVGDVLDVGPAGVPVEVVDFVSDTSYLQQGALWVEPGTWRTIQTESRPDAAVADGVFQVVLVVAGEGVDAGELADRIDEATAGATSSLTRDEAVLSLPGIRQQNSVFTALIGVTLFVAGLVAALFFALVTLERTSLYATLKALGAPSSRLALGVVLQSVVVALGAVVLGGTITVALAQVIPDAVPVQVEPSRVVTSSLLVLVTAAVGALVSLRRIVRIDPATAIS
ncbi:MAG TPA: ABC transporter permease [Acidimicrobiales bacterium]|jgi:putative ABC transport system permease protein|nr:ABC transporter permease [Acidimicrobiales bacterium]